MVGIWLAVSGWWWLVVGDWSVLVGRRELIVRGLVGSWRLAAGG